MRNWFIRLEWKPQDLWVGVFWKALYDHSSIWPMAKRVKNGRWVRSRVDVWVCIVPMVPIHFVWLRGD